MGFGSSLAARAANQMLGDRIVAADRARSRRWRSQFMFAWLLIVLALIAFVLITISLDIGFIAKWLPFILTGVPITIFVSFVSILLAIVLAVLGALGRLSPNPYLNGVASFYVSFFRGTPLLLQIVFIYFALPQMGIVLPEVPTGIIALGFNYGAYMTEVFRSGIQAVPHGQTEAALSLGMSARATFRRIIVPQAFRIVTPAIGNDFIAMLKDSSLVSVISVHELLYQAQVAGRPNHKSMQTLLVAAFVYWVLTIAFSFFQARLERRQAVGDRARTPR
jgi:polar amino acid transport system permease protein